jgi:hypothetical protein
MVYFNLFYLFIYYKAFKFWIWYNLILINFIELKIRNENLDLDHRKQNWHKFSFTKNNNTF